MRKMIQLFILKMLVAFHKSSQLLIDFATEVAHIIESTVCIAVTLAALNLPSFISLVWKTNRNPRVSGSFNLIQNFHHHHQHRRFTPKKNSINSSLVAASSRQGMFR